MGKTKHPQSRADRRTLDTKHKKKAKKMVTETRDISISLSNIEAQIIAFLYATTVLADDEEVIELNINCIDRLEHDPVEMTLKIKKMEEVKEIELV